MVKEVKQIGVVIDREVFDLLKEYARQNYRNAASVYRQAFDRFANEIRGKKNPPVTRLKE